MSESRKYTEAQKQSAKKWDAANLDRVSIALPKGKKDTIKAHAEARGESVNGFINRAISETMERDAGGPQEAAGASLEGGVVFLPPDTLKSAQEGAQAAGEGLPQFIARAVESQMERDKTKGGEPNE